MVSKVLGVVLVLALVIPLATTSIIGPMQVFAANSTKAAGNATTPTAAANSTKAAGNATSGNPITQLGQAIANGLKGLGNLMTGNKK